MKFEHTQVWGFEHAMRGMRNPKNSWKLGDTYESSWANAAGNWSFHPEKYQVCRYQGFDAILINIGPKDMKLAQTLIKSGPEHRKFLRQIFVSVDITAPLYWWKEFDTYKIGTVANSTSTMHKLMSKPITRESFEIDDFDEDLSVQKVDQSDVTPEGKACDFKAHWHMDSFADKLIEHLEDIRQDYIRWKKAAEMPTGDPEWPAHCEDMAYHLWKELVRWLPESWLQTRTVTMNYENLLSICSKSQRRFHKLNEWSGKHNKELSNFISWARKLPYAQEFIFIDELEDPKTDKQTQDGEHFAQVNGDFLTKLCSYLYKAETEHLSLKDFGVELQNEDGTMKSTETILQELASKI